MSKMIKVIPRPSQNLHILSQGLAGWDCLILPSTHPPQLPRCCHPHQASWNSRTPACMAFNLQAYGGRDHRHTPIHNRLEENKISRNKLNQEVSDLDNENFKPLKEKTQKDTRKWKDMPLPCSRTDRISIVEMTILSKVIDRFCAVPIKITISFFTETLKKNLVKRKRPWIAKRILIKRTMLER